MNLQFLIENATFRLRETISHSFSGLVEVADSSQLETIMNQEQLKALREELVRQRGMMESLLNQVEVNSDNVLLWNEEMRKHKQLLQEIDGKVAAILN